MRNDCKKKKDVKVSFQEKDLDQIYSIPNFLDKWQYVNVNQIYIKEAGLIDLKDSRIRFVQE